MGNSVLVNSRKYRRDSSMEKLYKEEIHHCTGIYVPVEKHFPSEGFQLFSIICCQTNFGIIFERKLCHRFEENDRYETARCEYLAIPNVTLGNSIIRASSLSSLKVFGFFPVGM